MLSEFVPPAGFGIARRLIRHVLRSDRTSNPISGRFVLVWMICGWMSGMASAQTFFWGTESFAAHRDSRGREWDSRFSLEMGVFKDGFVPTAENYEQWPGCWRVISLAEFDAEDMRFAGRLDTADVPAEYLGRRLFVWAKDGVNPEEGPQWVLMTHPHWKTSGTPGSATAPATTWITTSAEEFIVGGVAGDGRSLQSGMVKPAPVSHAEWIALHFGDNGGEAGPSDDPDGDGVVNLLEYALGSDPKRADPGKGPRVSTFGNMLRVSLEKNPRADAMVRLEKSVDLKTWTPITGDVLDDRPHLLEAAMPVDSNKRTWFFRAVVESVEVTE